MRLEKNEFALWQRTIDTARTAIHPAFIAHTQYVYVEPWYCSPNCHPKTNQMILRNTETVRSTYDLLGTRVSPRERRGYHKKKKHYWHDGASHPKVDRCQKKGREYCYRREWVQDRGVSGDEESHRSGDKQTYTADYRC